MKTLYKTDILLLEKLNLIKQGSVILADNLLYPGAPDYRDYVRSNSKYKSTTFPCMSQDNEGVRDEMEKSIYLGY